MVSGSLYPLYICNSFCVNRVLTFYNLIVCLIVIIWFKAVSKKMDLFIVFIDPYYCRCNVFISFGSLIFFVLHVHCSHRKPTGLLVQENAVTPMTKGIQMSSVHY